MSRSEDDGLSIGQEHELLVAFEKAGISAKEVQAIISAPDNLLAKRLVQVTNTYVEDVRAEYSRLFDSQLNLNHLGNPGILRSYPKRMINILRAQKDRVLDKALDLTIPNGSMPFIPVIPREFRTAFDQFDELGIPTSINLADIKYEDEVPKLPYYIFGIDYQSGFSGKSLAEFYREMSRTQLKGLTDVEMVALKRAVKIKAVEGYATPLIMCALNTRHTIPGDITYACHSITISGNRVVDSDFGYLFYDKVVVPSFLERMNPEVPLSFT